MDHRVSTITFSNQTASLAWGRGWRTDRSALRAQVRETRIRARSDELKLR